MFHIGQEVVCIDDSSQARSFCYPAARHRLLPHGLKKGAIYTVTAVGVTHPDDMLQLPCICVDGNNEHPYWASRFRPLTKTENEVSNEAEAV